MASWIWQFLSTEGFQPHGMCLLWRSDVFWAHLISDTLIALSYFSIPVAIIYFAYRRPDIAYGWVLHLFGAFIVACGVTHVYGIWTMWVPDYGAEAVVKIATAAVSLTTAIALWPLMPRMLAVPSPRQLEEKNARLAQEIAVRGVAEVRLRELNDALEQRVAVRTASLAQSNIELRQARACAERSAQAKADFLASMSHEIRTPMNGVIGMLDLLTWADMPSDQARYLEIARDSARSLLTVINDVLDHSRLESGTVELEETRFSPRQLVERSVALLAGGAAGKGVPVEMDPAEDIPDAVVGDPTRLRQILFNLIGNAIKFTEAGEIRVGLAHRVEPDGAITLDLTVRDTGIGIPPEAQARLFDRFTQADSSTARRYGGTGLGLAISKQLVELMGGSIGVESEPGRGSLFWFSITCAPALAAGPEPDTGGAACTVPPDHPSRILVVEDNAVNQILVTQLLGRFGHEVDLAATGAEALEALKLRDYDLVLMDIFMPGMDGVTTTRMIRRMTSAAARIPIVALTANAMPGDRETYLAAGMTDYVSKPIDPTALFAAIRRALERRFGGDGAQSMA
jgi:signal transduction histidine kinase/ActR/RegA family two-component response regulator